MMPERPHSELPDDPQYWQDLAARIGADARAPLAAYAAASESWYDVLGRHAGWWVAGAAALLIALWLLPPVEDSDTAVAAWIEASLAPDEPAARLVVGPAAPTLERLLVELAMVAERGR